MGQTKASRLLLERLGIYSTFRHPGSTVSPNDNPIHTGSGQSVKPLPLPDLVFNGDPPPDRGLTLDPWAHGEIEDDVS